MRLPIVLFVATTLFLGACIHAALEPVEVRMLSAPVSYEADVQPLIDRRCAVCHSYLQPWRARSGTSCVARARLR